MYRKTLSGRVALCLTPVVISALSIVAPAGTAVAGPCDQSKFYTKVWKGPVDVKHRDDGNHSYYNPAGGPKHDAIDLSMGYALNYDEVRHWVVGGEAGGDWKVVSAKISGEYGRSYTQGVSLSGSVTHHLKVPNRHTGWLRVVTYQRVVYWEKYHYVWNGSSCVATTTDKAFWGDQQRQWVHVIKKGHRYP